MELFGWDLQQKTLGVPFTSVDRPLSKPLSGFICFISQDSSKPWNLEPVQNKPSWKRTKRTAWKTWKWNLVTWNIPQGLGIKMGISENSGAPKSPILIGFSSINHPFWGTFIFGNTHLRRVAQMFIEVSWNLKRTCSKSLPVFSEETSAQARQSCPWGSHNRDVAGHGKGFRFRQILTFWLFELGGLFFSQFLFVSKCDHPFFWKFFLLAGWLDLLALFCRLGLADDYWVTLVRRFSPFSGG